MKNLIYIVILMLFSVQSFAQRSHQNFPPPIHQISNPDLEQRLRNIRMYRSETERMRELIRLSEVTAFSTEQVIHVCNTTLSNETARLDFSKHAYDNCFDKENYFDVCDVFTRFSKAIALYHYISRRNTEYTSLPNHDNHNHNQWNNPDVNNNNWNNNNTGWNACAVSDSELESIKQSVSKESFAATKMQIAKDAVKAKKCFKALQIKELISLFTFESDKLALAKFAYDFCIDKDNYFTVNDGFEFSTSKEELSKFINEKR